MIAGNCYCHCYFNIPPLTIHHSLAPSFSLQEMLLLPIGKYLSRIGNKFEYKILTIRKSDICLIDRVKKKLHLSVRISLNALTERLASAPRVILWKEMI